jgi:hypothetical protein
MLPLCFPSARLDFQCRSHCLVQRMFGTTCGNSRTGLHPTLSSPLHFLKHSLAFPRWHLKDLCGVVTHQVSQSSRLTRRIPGSRLTGRKIHESFRMVSLTISFDCRWLVTRSKCSVGTRPEIRRQWPIRRYRGYRSLRKKHAPPIILDAVRTIKLVRSSALTNRNGTYALPDGCWASQLLHVRYELSDVGGASTC